jgi:hypothetical protein
MTSSRSWRPARLLKCGYGAGALELITLYDWDSGSSAGGPVPSRLLADARAEGWEVTAGAASG